LEFGIWNAWKPRRCSEACDEFQIHNSKFQIACIAIAFALVTAGCAASKALRQGDAATKSGDYDQAVSYYRAAVQAAPNNPNFKIALERAMLVASRVHLERAKDYEDHDQLEAARSEYKLASEYDPSNGYATLKIATLDQKIRDRIEASRPHPLDDLRERARAASSAPILNPASPVPIDMHYTNARVGDILNTIGSITGISVTSDRDAQSILDRATTINIDGLTLEQALNLIMTMNGLSYKVLNERTIFVFQDTNQKHNTFDDQVIKTFYVANADATELVQTLSGIARFTQLTSIQPIILANKTANTITVRSTPAIVDIVEKMIEQNDKPKAEVMFDIEILEVDRNRAKTYGLNLTQYAVGSIFSPEVSPGATTTTTGGGTAATPGGTPAAGTTTTTGRSTPPDQVASPPAFNLNTVSQGVSTTDFYLAVPAAIVRFLESDSHTRLMAKPQLRGTDGVKTSVNLGTEVPVVSTSYTPLATGGAAVNPLNSFSFRPVGINIEITPRVSLDGDISMDLTVESSTQGPDQNVAGANYPSFGTRKVTTHLRLRDGESNLLAGLLREDDTNAVTGFPGAIHVPFLKQLFSSNDHRNAQLDIVMLLTPHIIRTAEVKADDLKGIYIGSTGNLGVGGPPPLIAAPPDQTPAPATTAPPAQTTPTIPAPGGVLVQPPPGSSPIPGTVPVPPPAPPGQQGATAQAPPPQAAVTPSPAPPPQAQTFPQPNAVDPTAATAAAALAAGNVPQGVVGSAQVVITPPQDVAFRVGGGPYTLPISIVNASRLSMITLTVTFNPALLRVRSVQEGSFMRIGGANATFTNQVGNGRVDITIVRAADATGASGTGLLGALLFDTVAPGSATLTISGAATGPGGTPMGLQFQPTTIVVQP
jgi:general secretion pathway protein D